MTATVAAPATELPGVAALSPAQLEGLACARCGRRLSTMVGRARKLGEIVRPSPLPRRPVLTFDLYACVPTCVILPRRASIPTPRRRASIADLPSWTPPDTGPAIPVGDNSEATMRRVLAALRAMPDTPPP